MKRKIRNFTDSEIASLYKAIDMMADYIRGKILESLGNRQIDEHEFRELTEYWVASVVHTYRYRDKDREPIDFSKMSEEEIQKHFLADYDTEWTRGIEEYNRMAGTSLIDIINQKLKVQSGVEVLDVGCGQALFLRELQERYGDAVKCHGAATRNHDKTETVDFRLALAEVLPEEWSDKFDLVTCFESSMYFWDQERAFNEALRAMKPDGRLFYGTNNLKTGTNDYLLGKRLGLQNFSYTFPEESTRAGQVCTGVFAKYMSKIIPFMIGLGEIVDRKDKTGRFERHGKLFEMRRKYVEAWCTETLQVKGAGYKE